MKKHINILLIVIDTLRYDYSLSLREELISLGFKSYDNAYSTYSWTTPSHASIFTGKYSSLHGAHENTYKKYKEIILKDPNIITKFLKDSGYKTILFSSNPHIRPSYGFTNFDYFYDYEYKLANIMKISEKYKKDIEKLSKDVDINVNNKIKIINLLIYRKKFKLLIVLFFNFLINGIYKIYNRIINNWPKKKGLQKFLKIFKKKKFINSIKNSKYFIFMNLMECHDPYEINEKEIFSYYTNISKKSFDYYDNKYMNKLKNLYNNEILYIKKGIIKIIKILKKNNMFDNTLIIITSDHGQLFGEHNKVLHGMYLYDELIKVPLMIKYPENLKIKFVKEQFKIRNRISLKNLYNILLKISKIEINNIFNESNLYSNVIFSENFGIQVEINSKNKIDIEEMKKCNQYKIAVYKNDNKAIFNVNKWKFESFNDDENMKIDEELEKDLKNEIINFLNKASSHKNMINKFKERS